MLCPYPRVTKSAQTIFNRNKTMKEFFQKIWNWIKAHVLEAVLALLFFLAMVLIFCAAKLLENEGHHLYAFVTFLGGVSVFFQGMMFILKAVNNG